MKRQLPHLQDPKVLSHASQSKQALYQAAVDRLMTTSQIDQISHRLDAIDTFSSETILKTTATDSESVYISVAEGSGGNIFPGATPCPAPHESVRLLSRSSMRTAEMFFKNARQLLYGIKHGIQGNGCFFPGQPWRLPVPKDYRQMAGSPANNLCEVDCITSTQADRPCYDAKRKLSRPTLIGKGIDISMMRQQLRASRKLSTRVCFMRGFIKRRSTGISSS